jgi:deazaflavin-dependent oxidoreductase (nitroreductase family)
MSRRCRFWLGAFAGSLLVVLYVLRRRDPAAFAARAKRLRELAYFTGEYISMLIAPHDKPSPFMIRAFRLPLRLYELGLGSLVGQHILVLTTTGRRTGRPHTVAVGYAYEPDGDTYLLTAGWQGGTDWFRNARANPRVRVQVGERQFDADAEPLALDARIPHLIAYTQRNPYAGREWPLVTGRPFDGSREAYRELAARMPMLAIHPQ